MKKLFMSALFVSGSLLAQASLAEDFSAETQCAFMSGENVGVCYQNQTGTTLSDVVMLVTTGSYSSSDHYPSIPTQQFATSTTIAQELKNHGVNQITYSLMVNGKILCPSLSLSATPLSSPVVYVITGDSKNPTCQRVG